MNGGGYLGFLCSLGALLVATLGAPIWVAPRFFGFGRKLVGWLMAAVALRALAEAPDLLRAAEPGALTVAELQFAGIAASLLFFAEAARNGAFVVGRRMASPWWHLAGAALCGAHLAVLFVAERRAVPEWCRLFSWLGPAVVAGYAIGGLWQALDRVRQQSRRNALKVAVVGFASSGVLALLTPPAEHGLAPAALIWLTAVSLAALVLTLPEFRRQVALAMVSFLAAIPFLIPVVSELSVRVVTGRLEDRTRAAAEAGTRGMAFVAGPNGAVTAAAGEADPGRRLQELRRADTALSAAYFATPRGGGLQRLEFAPDGVRLVPHRAATPAEGERLRAGGAAFLTVPEPGTEERYVAAFAPVAAAAGPSPAAWLVLEYPEAIWTLQAGNARRGGELFMAVLAVFLAAALTLGSAQAVEGARQSRLHRAEAADRARRQFLAFLSHELRTPLQSVLGRAELLQQAPLAPADHRRVNLILEDGKLLLRLVTDLLDLGAIEAGRLQLRPAPGSLRRAVEACVETFAGRAREKGLRLECRFADDFPDRLVMDEARVRQMVGNLLGNAVKFTEAGGVELLVRAAAADDDEPAPALPPGLRMIEVVVRDTGPGVPPAQIDRLFSLFGRIDAGDAVRREGTGVGLALVYRLCRLMGGSVRAANRPEGGAEFRLRLPFAETAEADPAEARPAAGGSGAPHRRRVLVVEDNPSAREWLLDAISGLGCEAEAAETAGAALAVMAAGRFEVVVLDVNLPDRDGLDLARELRARQPGLRLIGCSAEAFASTREAAIGAGMDVFLTKPVALAELEQALRLPGAEGGNLFARLQSPSTTARAQAALLGEWPAQRSRTETSLVAGDRESLRRLGHYLRSTALLVGDERLGQLCRELSAAAGAADPAAEGRRLLEELDTHFRNWPAGPGAPSSPA